MALLLSGVLVVQEQLHQPLHALLGQYQFDFVAAI
jgi:hypothetical protein